MAGRMKNSSLHSSFSLVTLINEIMQGMKRLILQPFDSSLSANVDHSPHWTRTTSSGTTSASHKISLERAKTRQQHTNRMGAFATHQLELLESEWGRDEGGGAGWGIGRISESQGMGMEGWEGRQCKEWEDWRFFLSSSSFLFCFFRLLPLELVAEKLWEWGKKVGWGAWNGRCMTWRCDAQTWMWSSLNAFLFEPLHRCSLHEWMWFKGSSNITLQVDLW